jgi:Rrf2 family protein
MYRFSESVSIALHGLILVRDSDHRMNVKEIAEKTASYANTVAKVFQILSKNGLVSSVRGASGGFVITDKGLQTSFLDIIFLFDGEHESSVCPVHKEKCPFSKCFLNDEYFRLNRELRDYFKNIKISEV